MVLWIEEMTPENQGQCNKNSKTFNDNADMNLYFHHYKCLLHGASSAGLHVILTPLRRPNPNQSSLIHIRAKQTSSSAKEGGHYREQRRPWQSRICLYTTALQLGVDAGIIIRSKKASKGNV